MAAEAEAAREARAKVIAAEGEMKASRALKEASDVMAESPGALQLRYLQTLNSISAEKNSTIIFPLPLDILTPFLKPSHFMHHQYQHQNQQQQDHQHQQYQSYQQHQQSHVQPPLLQHAPLQQTPQALPAPLAAPLAEPHSSAPPLSPQPQ
jgi:erythrocyte band 7 integral membrane protein